MYSRSDPTTQNEVRELFKYDPSGRLIWRPRQGRGVTRFNGVATGSVIGKDRRRRRFVEMSDRRTIAAARLIWIWHHGGIPPGLQIDHINRDALDDRIENLRLATPQENAANREYKRGAVPFIGVHYRKDRQRYVASARVDGRMKIIGHYVCAEDAAKARDQYVLEHRPEFCVLNFGGRDAITR